MLREELLVGTWLPSTQGASPQGSPPPSRRGPPARLPSASRALRVTRVSAHPRSRACVSTGDLGEGAESDRRHAEPVHRPDDSEGVQRERLHRGRQGERLRPSVRFLLWFLCPGRVQGSPRRGAWRRRPAGGGLPVRRFTKTVPPTPPLPRVFLGLLPFPFSLMPMVEFLIYHLRPQLPH